MLQSTNEDFIDQAFWGFGNISGDCSVFRDKVMQVGIHLMNEHLRNAFQSGFHKIYFNNACWTLSNICRTIPHPPFPQIR
jgi:hypothetical protein